MDRSGLFFFHDNTLSKMIARVGSWQGARDTSPDCFSFFIANKEAAWTATQKGYSKLRGHGKCLNQTDKQQSIYRLTFDSLKKMLMRNIPNSHITRVRDVARVGNQHARHLVRHSRSGSMRTEKKRRFRHRKSMPCT